MKVLELLQRAQQLLGEGVIHLAAVAGDDKTGTAACQQEGSGASASRPSATASATSWVDELDEGA